MESEYRASLVAIKSNRPGNKKFGTGFIVDHDERGTVVLTCDHVARDVLLNGDDSTVVVLDTGRGEHVGRVQDAPTEQSAVDLAVIRIDGDALRRRPKLPLLNVEKYVLERPPHILAFKAPFGEAKRPDFYRYDFKTPLPPNFTLQNDPSGVPIGKGDSGSPVFDSTSGMVIGVAYRTPDMGGEADVIYVIAISELPKIWPEMPVSLLQLPDSQAVLEIENQIATGVQAFGRRLEMRVLIAAMPQVDKYNLNKEAAIVKGLLQKVLLNSSFRDMFDVDVLEWSGEDQLARVLSTTRTSESPPNLHDLTGVDVGVILIHERSDAPESTQAMSDVVSKLRALAASSADGRPLRRIYSRQQTDRVDPGVQLLLRDLESYDQIRVYDTNSEKSRRQSEFNRVFIDDFRLLLGQFVERHLEVGGADSLHSPVTFRNPYKGLDVYTVDDGGRFFGRVDEVNELLKLLSEDQDGFIAIVGASGSGKSSLARAGLLYNLSLNAIPGSESWEVIEIRLNQVDKRNKPLPPLEIVATVLYERLHQHDFIEYESIDDLEQRVTAPASIEDVVAALIGDASERRVLFFIDQFEELFTLHHGEDGELNRSRFTTFLLEAVNNRRVCVVLTLRSDFYAHCGETNISDLFNAGQYLLGFAGTDKRLDMITRPAAFSGLTFAPYLQQRIILDMGEASGALPLMSYLLQALAESRTVDNRMTIEAYDHLGGVQGVIERAAEQCIADLKARMKLSDDQIQVAMQTVFRKLITISQDDRPSKRPTAYDQEELTLDWTSEARALANALVEARLLETDKDASNKPILEITHERLLHSWRRLRDWITATRGALLDRQRAEIAAHEWVEARIKVLDDRLPDRFTQPSTALHWGPATPTPFASLTAEQPGKHRTARSASDGADLLNDAVRSALNQRLTWLGIERSRLSVQVQAWADEMPRDFYAALRDPFVDHQHLWDHQRLQLLRAALEQLGADTVELSAEMQAFIRPETERLVEELELEATRHDRRKAIGDRLAEIGDPRPGVGLTFRHAVGDSAGVMEEVPDFVWCKVAGGGIVLRMDDGSSVEVGEVGPFYIAQHMVTLAQWRVFWKEPGASAPDRFNDAKNWEGLEWWQPTDDPDVSQRFPQYTPYSSEQNHNHPVEWATWYQAVAYTRALNRMFGCEPDNIRLPTEWEWQLAAGGSEPGRNYPWGNEWEPTKANTKDGGSYTLVAVGLYPHGASPCGALDMIGNCFQWCRNRSDLVGGLAVATSYAGGPSVYRATRGAAWFYTKLADHVKEDARITRRFDERPDGRQKEKEGHIRVGIRLACDVPPEGSRIVDMGGVKGPG